MREVAMRGKLWLTAGFALAAIVIPQVVSAATGSFSSGTQAPALTAKNTGIGNAIFGWAATYNADTPNSGVLGRSDGYQGRGLTGVAASPTGINFGVYGVSSSTSGTGVAGIGGMFGIQGRSSYAPEGRGVTGVSSGSVGVGVAGTATGTNAWGVYGKGGKYGVVGYGNDFGLISLSDAGLKAHLVARNGDVAGTCTIAAASTSQACSFATAFGAGISPVVVVTPTSNPGSFFWVSGTTSSGFTVTLASQPGSDVTFNYVVVGVKPEL